MGPYGGGPRRGSAPAGGDEVARAVAVDDGRDVARARVPRQEVRVGDEPRHARTSTQSLRYGRADFSPTEREVGMASISERENREIEAAKSAGGSPVVFIHGLWLLPSSWASWA